MTYFALTSQDATNTYAFQVHACKVLISKINNSTHKVEAHTLTDLNKARRCWSALIHLKGYRKGTA